MQKDFSQPTVVSDVFVLLALEAGVGDVIKRLMGIGKPVNILIQEVYSEILPLHPDIAEALNFDTFRAVVDYMTSIGEPVTLGFNLPQLLDEDGPTNVSAVRNAQDPTKLRVTFDAPPNGYRAKLFVDGKIVTMTDVGDVTVDGVGLDKLKVRVVYQKKDTRGLSRFSQMVTVKKFVDA